VRLFPTSRNQADGSFDSAKSLNLEPKDLQAKAGDAEGVAGGAADEGVVAAL
jgi:hypothetical protein